LSFKAGAHWEISPAEATQLSGAVANVARHYPVASSQKAADWAQFAIVAATISGPRALQSWSERSPIGQQPGLTQPPASPAAAQPYNGQAGVVTPSQLDPVSMAGSYSTTGTA
jgi:hypothetical protein